MLADIEQGALDRAVAELRAAGAEAHGVVCDVRSLEAVRGAGRRRLRALGSVHVVFNNAGIAVGGPILEMTHDDWRWTIDVDLWGPIHGVEAFLPRIVEQGEGGHILFTASFAGLVPNSGLGPYCVAKYGVVALAEVLYRELREHRIGVSVLCPMRVGTNIGNSERNRQADYGRRAEQSLVLDQDADNADLAGRVLEVDGVARADRRRHRAEPPVHPPPRGEPGVDPPPLRPHRPHLRVPALALRHGTAPSRSLARRLARLTSPP